MGQDKNPIADMLAARTTSEVRGEELVYRIRTLSPSEAVRLQMGMSMLAAATRGEDGERTAATEDQTVAMTERMCQLACSVVMAAKKPRGRQWWDLRLVTTMDQQDPSRDRVFVGGIPDADIISIVTAATETYRRAADLAAPFPE